MKILKVNFTTVLYGLNLIYFYIYLQIFIEENLMSIKIY